MWTFQLDREPHNLPLKEGFDLGAHEKDASVLAEACYSGHVEL